MLTGSKNPDDYIEQPQQNLNALPSWEALLSTPLNYISIRELFDIDESQFRRISATVSSATTYDGCKYEICLDDVRITVLKNNCIERRNNYSDPATQFVVDYEEGMTIQSVSAGYVRKEYNGIQVLLKVERNVYKQASFVLNGMYIRIENTIYSTSDVLEEDHENFMSDPKFEKIARLFSEDTATFNAAISELRTKQVLNFN